MSKLTLTTLSGKVLTMVFPDGEVMIYAGRENIDDPVDFDKDVFKWTYLETKP